MMSIGAVPAFSAPQAHVAEIVHPSLGAGDSFSIALELEGNDAVLAAPYKGPKFRGRAWVYDGATGTLRYALSPSTSNAGDAFGLAVSVHGGLAAISAATDFAGTNAGSVFLFDLASGSQLFEFRARDGAAGDQFGQSIALGPGRLIVGAPGVDGGLTDAGAVYVFNTQTGAQIHKLACTKPVAGMRLGQLVTLEGGYVISSAQWNDPDPGRGTAFVFDLLGGKQLHRLDDPLGQEGDNFASCLSAAEGTLVVGAPGAEQWPYEEMGKVLVFDLPSGALLQTLPPPANIAEFDRFGSAVALADGLLAVSAPGADGAGLDLGAVHLFDRDSGTHLGEFARYGTLDGDRFGTRLSASGSRLLVGVPFADDAGTDSGKAHLYCLQRFFGAPFCDPANSNSTGLPGRLMAYGSGELSCGQFQLAAFQLPPAKVAMALASMSQDWIPLVGGSAGNLCLGGALGRFRQDMAYVDPDGSLFFPLDLNNLPAPLAGSVQPGETWYFQVWHRDKGGLSNLTEGLQITFQ